MQLNVYQLNIYYKKNHQIELYYIILKNRID